jgi:CDGSH-type Zn-finger protein
MNQEAERTPMVVFTKYSPYMVVDVGTCIGEDGKPVAMQAVTSLCRCGHSGHKPYCDGTHATIGFVGENGTERTKSRVRDYVGKEITIHDNRRICSHDESCVRGLPLVFRMERRPWIDPDGASPEQIMATIERCPSGALSYTYKDRRMPDSQREHRIRVVKDGPYQLSGGIRVKDDLGSAPQSAEHCTLCRCGVSKNKPFCDGSHDELDLDH